MKIIRFLLGLIGFMVAWVVVAGIIALLVDAIFPGTMSATYSGREVSLESFFADSAQARTHCGLRVREAGLVSSAWHPVSFEVSDATGNHWKPPIDQVQSTNGLFDCSLFGALWPDEDAWKVRVEFKPATTRSPSGTPWAVEFLARPDHRQSTSHI